MSNHWRDKTDGSSLSWMGGAVFGLAGLIVALWALAAGLGM